ncbi:hypothetical protein Xcel_0864 [Xylanimonas cellulosilytica DSM 15894]|uniref:Uncharacterized protein n=1 Tax=Xylanimonas cellulosilytica (strain DSM 15894 / JCM 12276 / CECT 5975 / KCTC 9989 / LMG 20990 / NBRC 107835 / XIL07) TaxID=446471 RepID=D1BY53_XYLCX|nr:hypothetical protein [Xylanimonas cellulosilytica]ACZ29896.1 hypothetical protein Xcel_0864 [Xylanimonas cellulosilytica DSM 15894]
MGVAAILALTVSAAPASAQLGLKSTSGANYSQDFNTAGSVRACDMVADSHAVFAEFTITGSGTLQSVRDGNGASNACEATGDYGARKIYKHRITVDKQLAPDAHGDWKYPS